MGRLQASAPAQFVHKLRDEERLLVAAAHGLPVAFGKNLRERLELAHHAVLVTIRFDDAVLAVRMKGDARQLVRRTLELHPAPLALHDGKAAARRILRADGCCKESRIAQHSHARSIDAIETAEAYGIDRSKAVNYLADEEGTHEVYASVSHAMRNVRESGTVGSDPSWRDRIDADYNRRGRK